MTMAIAMTDVLVACVLQNTQQHVMRTGVQQHVAVIVCSSF